MEQPPHLARKRPLRVPDPSFTDGLAIHIRLGNRSRVKPCSQDDRLASNRASGITTKHIYHKPAKVTMAVNGHLELSNQISIAELEPSVISQEAFIEGVVTLIWPYSSSDKSFSILLAEADFRLRRHKGQVRIHFTNSSAKAAAKSRILSGDQVRIKLAGAQWEKDETTSSTPGKGIGWELRFGERLVLQV